VNLFQYAEAQRDIGMLRAARHAETVHMHWNDEAYAFLVGFAKANESFISEDVSDASKKVGFPQPPTDRAWGSVYRKAVRNAIIGQTGIGRSRRRHASICPQWGSLIFHISCETNSVSHRVPVLEGPAETVWT
jgi:hypothetical protein